ncbi:ABC transporter permease [Georgenia faecalis]|uniref:ABC transporter permease n=1 Tax=Georgenia faecalis TaxID=2483799 RepID=A0ABV9DDG5_9MICO|nr:ABC transporter permease [Georgenia faecalis]
MSDDLTILATTSAEATPVDAGTAPGRRGRGRRRAARSVSFTVGALLVGLVVLAGLVSLVWSPYPLTDDSGPRLGGPSAEHWAGTDRLGRDLFTQLLDGAGNAVLVAASTTAIAAAIGVLVGIVAATTTRWLDVALQSVVDLLIAFPTLLLAMLIVTVRGASMSSAIVAIGLAGSAVIARVTRVNTARVLREDYITAAAASGTGYWGTVLRHVLPNITPTLLVQLMLLAGGAVLSEASLSYLGLGAPPPQASWGRMLREAQSTIGVQPWGAIFPGVAIAAFVLGLNLLGDGIRERRDPSLGGRR